MIGVVKRTWRSFGEHDLSDGAASLTYYAVLSIFPALIVLMGVVGQLSSGAVHSLVGELDVATPGPARDIALNSIRSVQAGGGAGLALVIGLAGALWAASGYVGAFVRAHAQIHGLDDERPMWRGIVWRLLMTAALLIVVATGALAVVLTGPLARSAGDVIGVGSTAVQVWDIAKWPVLVGLGVVVVSLLYRTASAVPGSPPARWITPGAVVAVVLWVVASALFSVYVATFGSYNKTYGALAGVIVLLVWLWITNLILLLGAELNAQLARPADGSATPAATSREPRPALAAGGSADR